MIKKYSIILKSQLGPKTGTLRVRFSTKRLLGILELLGHKSLLAGKPLDDSNHFAFCGKMWTPLGKVECSVSGAFGERTIQGEVRINNKVYNLSGKEDPKALNQSLKQYDIPEHDRMAK